MTAERKTLLVWGLMGAGQVAGIGIAIHRKSGFWGGVGWFILGGFAGAAIGKIAAGLIADSPAPATTPADVSVKAIDPVGKTAIVTIKGKDVTIAAGQGFAVGDGLSVEYKGDAGGGVEIKKDGIMVSQIS